MSSKTAIVTDTNCGLRPEEAAELGIRVIPMPVILDGECFFEYDSISQAEFFEALKGGAEVSTSQPAPGPSSSAGMPSWRTARSSSISPCPPGFQESARPPWALPRITADGCGWRTIGESP